MTVTATNPSIAPPKYQNAAEWLHDLGDVPLDRILCNPWPSTATEADLLHKVEVERQLCELIDGTLVEKPMGYYESLLAIRIAQLLMNFIEPRELGAVSGEAGMLRLSKGLVRLPDVAFIAAEKLRGRDPHESIPSLAPDLAVEVLSRSNTRREIDRKITEYFSAGTRLVWVIDPSTRSAISYSSVAAFERVELSGSLRGGEVVPGFEISLSELFQHVDDKFKSRQ